MRYPGRSRIELVRVGMDPTLCGLWGDGADVETSIVRERESRMGYSQAERLTFRA